jgi:hypothetical protein
MVKYTTLPCGQSCIHPFKHERKLQCCSFSCNVTIHSSTSQCAFVLVAELCCSFSIFFIFLWTLFFLSWPFSCFSYLTSMPENDPSVLHRLLHSGLQVNKIAAVQIRCTNLPRLIATVQKVSRAQSPLRRYALASSSSSFPSVTYQ